MFSESETVWISRPILVERSTNCLLLFKICSN